MAVSFDFTDRVALVTGAAGALGSAVVDAFASSGATVAATDVVAVDADESLLDPGEGVSFYQADFTDEPAVAETIDRVIDDHGRIDFLLAVAGTWRGGQPIEETPVEQFDLLFDVNLKTAFLAAKHALPALQETGGAVVTVSSRSGLEGGSGDAMYRASKAGVRILTESIAAEHPETVRANCVMPSVLDTPTNREMMSPSDDWVDPADVADVMQFLCSEAADVTSGAAVPVYGDA